jgi:hypothetical protein
MTRRQLPAAIRPQADAMFLLKIDLGVTRRNVLARTRRRLRLGKTSGHDEALANQVFRIWRAKTR